MEVHIYGTEAAALPAKRRATAIAIAMDIAIGNASVIEAGTAIATRTVGAKAFPTAITSPRNMKRMRRLLDYIPVRRHCHRVELRRPIRPCLTRSTGIRAAVLDRRRRSGITIAERRPRRTIRSDTARVTIPHPVRGSISHPTTRTDPGAALRSQMHSHQRKGAARRRARHRLLLPRGRHRGSENGHESVSGSGTWCTLALCRRRRHCSPRR